MNIFDNLTEDVTQLNFFEDLFAITLHEINNIVEKHIHINNVPNDYKERVYGTPYTLRLWPGPEFDILDNKRQWIADIDQTEMLVHDQIFVEWGYYIPIPNICYIDSHGLLEVCWRTRLNEPSNLTAYQVKIILVQLWNSINTLDFL